MPKAQEKSSHSIAKPATRWRPAIAALLFLCLSLLPVVAVADLPGEAQGTVAAVFSPGTSRQTALAAVVEAGGLVVRQGAWGNVVVARSDSAGFARRLRQLGALLVVDPRSAAGCLIAGDIVSPEKD